MELLIGYLQQGANLIVPFIILLGLLIFVHEMGHFLVAKYFGVRVEVFSMGFGKKIWEFKRGDTTYCVSIVPLGGYVKMYGDEPGAEIPEEQKRFSFTHKPVSQRFAVVLAGPLMNFFFAILVFALMSVTGEQTVRPVLGDVIETSQAYKDGFRSGDEIKAVNGQHVQSWDELQERVEASADQAVSFEVVRSGSTLEFKSTPHLVRNKNPLSTRSLIGEIEGLSFNSKASVVAVLGDSPAAKAGLKTGDQIESINDVKVETWRALNEVLAREVAKENSTETLQLKVQRINEKKNGFDPLSVSLAVPQTARAQSGLEQLKALGFDSPDLYLSQVFDKSPAREAGLNEGDRLVAINGQALTKWDEVIELVKNYKAGGSPLEVRIVRQGEEKTFAMTPQMKKQMTPQGKEEERFILGITPTVALAAPELFVRQTTNPVQAVTRGVELSWKWTKLTVLGFVKLIQNEVSPKNIGGVISIAQVASRSFEAGLSSFLSIMGVISINLFIVNLLPVPVLDGGHLLFYTMEALRGRPLSMRKLEIAQQVGLILLISLMAYALFNDFSRNLNL